MLRADTSDLALKWVKNLQQRRRALLDEDENEADDQEVMTQRLVVIVRLLRTIFQRAYPHKFLSSQLL
jgi:hypothetical protein